MSGLHMHKDTQGIVGGLHVSHAHSGITDAPGYEGDRDVSIFDPGTSGGKLPVILVALWLSLLLVSIPPYKASTGRLILLPHDWRSRWRPPLRAPPQYS